MSALFAYGTLQLPEVMLAVTGQHFTAYPARLYGYSRHSLRGRSFPGIRPTPEASVDGLLFVNIDALSWQKLDAFEDDFYQRETITVITLADQQQWTAHSYIVQAPAYDLLLPEAWSLEHFKQRNLDDFLRHHR
jgi:gamma-glutamylcyclotransferase (GGCT)/AIG2-like uncharacterized protein YtfP